MALSYSNLLQSQFIDWWSISSLSNMVKLWDPFIGIAVSFQRSLYIPRFKGTVQFTWTYGVPWNSELSKHELTKKLYSTTNTRGTVSALYSKILQASYKPITIQTSWQNDYGFITSAIAWDTVWKNIIQVKKNPNHQTIHLKIVHRIYLTPRLRHLIKLESSTLCQLCTQGTIGTFTHMFWECPRVQLFLSQVTKSLSKILNKVIPCCPVLCLLNDYFQFPMSIHDKRIWLQRKCW